MSGSHGGSTRGGDIFSPPVVVRPPTRGARPYRRVEIYGRTVGKAYGPDDVVEFLHHAGVPEPDLDDPDLVGWRGGDRTVWTAGDHHPDEDGDRPAADGDRPAGDSDQDAARAEAD
ncbi:hypothetical protein GCM10010441_41660 [Kitasatospora paracochleata]|uniref:DivIVA domain-containing protein n=1 Tax=Kitasatospora paracochleata TaxID=58354 RepID=A0ABT1J4T4_9ACTN|nr:hypothetical protein [Kitasatospora paracochleata]MCP2312393.1 hypothetical protein [Kitasatospora paracochleata]